MINNINKTNQMTTNNFHAYQKIKINMTTTFMSTFLQEPYQFEGAND